MLRPRIFVLTAALVLAWPTTAYAQREPAGAVNAGTYWQALGDPVLDRLIQQAMYANRDLRSAEARVYAARARRTHATLDLTPTVTANAGYSRQRMASASFPGAAGSLPSQDVWDAGIQVAWEVDVFGRLRRTRQGQNALLASAEDDERDVQVIVAAEVAREYYDLRGAEERLAVARRNAENQRRTLELTQDRLELGRGNALDTERAQAQLSSTLAAIPALESAITASEHRIAVLLGRAPTAAPTEELAAGTSQLDLPEDLPLENVDLAVRRRPDVRGAENRLAARRAFVGAAKASYLPRLSIGGVAGYTANQFDRIGGSGTPRYAIGPVISWPLLDLGRVKTDVDAAQAGEAEAAAQYEQTLLRAREEVETSLTAYRKARERLQHLEEAAAASERATELARLRFEGGATDFLEVLDAERRQLEAQDLLAAGRTEATSWLVSLYRALGGGVPAATR